MNKLDFDVNNHKELSSYIYFTNPSILTATKNSYNSNNVHSSSHDPFYDQVIRKIEKKIYSQKYYGEDTYRIQNYETSFLALLGNSITFYSQSSIEQEFSHLPIITQIQEKKLKLLSEFLTKKTTEEIMQMPIPTSRFPHFNETKTTKLSEEKLTAILLQAEKDCNNCDQKYMFTQKDLIQFYEILCQNQQTFSFSPTLFISAINKLDFFLNTLLTSTKSDLNSNDNNSNHKLINYLQHFDSNNDKEILNYYRLVLLIKLRLYAIMQKMHDFLQTLLELIIIDQQIPDFEKNDQFSFKNIINELVPKTQKRSTIVQNISFEQILDFSFSNDGMNDYFLTQDGIFKFNHIEQDDNFYQFNDSCFNKIEFGSENNTQIHEILKNSDKNSAKISFSNGILYLLCLKEKKIFRVRVSPSDEFVQREIELQRKAKNKEKYFELNQPKKNEKKNSQKKLKEKEKKQKRRKFKNEQEQEPEIEENFDCIQVNIPDFPIISIGVYNNFIRIAQKKMVDTKIVLIFTNVDISPNSRLNFDIFEAFESNEKVEKIIQKQFEIELKDNEYPQLIDACFYKNEILLLNNDSTFDQMEIFDDEKPQISKMIQSPYQFNDEFPAKIDDKKNLHIIIPINNTENNSISIYKISMNETKYFLREENSLFIKYPFLRNISNLVDNCSHMIINREITKPYTTEEYHSDAKMKGFYHEIKDEKEEFDFVSPEEMSFIIQSPKSIQPQFNNIKSLIENLKDIELKKFFIVLFIKLTGINLLYSTSSYYITNEPISDASLEMFVEFTKFISDIFSLFEMSGQLILRLILLESIIFTFSISGKFLLNWNGFDEFFLLFRKIFLYEDESSQFNVLDVVYLFSFLMFSYPSSLYIMQRSNCDLLFEIELDRKKLFPLFLNSINFIPIELRYSKMVWNDSFIKFIFEYIESLFKYIKYLLEEEENPLSMAEQLLSSLFSFNIDNISYSLKLEEMLVGISKPLFERIQKYQGVVESDKEYSNFHDIQKQTVSKHIKIIESEHPYNSKLTENSVQDIDIVDFGPEIGTIFVIFDDRFDLLNDEKLVLIVNDEPKVLERTAFFDYKAPLVFYSHRIKIQLLKSLKENSTKASYWGYKMTFIGVLFDNPYYWQLNVHLYFYDYFVSFLLKVHSIAFKSTELNDNEVEFNLILNDKIIQGIKVEDIDNYEESLNDNENAPSTPLRKALSRGISRGINFDIENFESYNEQFKKSFLNDLIKEENIDDSLGIQFLNVMYEKTTKLNRNKIRIKNQEILQCEHYLAACLLKHLGLINECINFITKINGIQNSEDEKLYKEIQVPNRLNSIWKIIYLLRKTMFFEYQKSKSIQNTGSQTNDKFNEYSLEIKRKCKLLLYSDPILKFMKKAVIENDSLETSAKIIYSFVTSKKPLSDISSLIDIRRERLNYSQKSIEFLLKFVNEKLLFESSKTNFAYFYNQIIPMRSCKGVKQSELDGYSKLFGNLSYSIIENVFSNPSISLISNAKFLEKCIRYNKDDETRLKSSEIFINILENNKKNKSFVHDKINFQMILLLLYICCKNKNNELVDYLIQLLSNNEEIDLRSKQLILIVMPMIVRFIPKNTKLIDESFAFSILYNNSNTPIIVKSTFYWLSLLIKPEHSSFVKKVLKGIGQSFTGKSCLFIDSSFQSFAHRQVAEGMISFIRLLANSENKILLEIVHDVLTNQINKINLNQNDDQLMISIGLFASFGQSLSAFEPERKISSEITENLLFNIIGYNTSSKRLRRSNNSNKRITGSFYNSVLFDQRKINLNEKEIENILKLHDVISHSKYFNEKINYENEINENEISENILIATFYSFLPVIMQNENNASLLMNEKNINRTLSLFDFSMNFIPTNENSILLLSHYLEQAIMSPLYFNEPKIDINRVDSKGSFRFMKMNFGEIIYKNENDLIKSDIDRLCTFIGTRPFDFRCETYYELKIRKIGKEQVFFGFIDCEDHKESKFFGFGYNDKKTFRCDPSTTASSKFFFTNNISDTLASTSIREGEKIGLYYTSEFIYMLVNGTFSSLRVSHKSFNSYVPIIAIDHDEIEIEMIRNITIVDLKKKQFDFLKIENLPINYFRGLNSIVGYFCKSPFAPFNEKKHFIGQQVYINKTISTESKTKMETIDVVPASLFHYKERYGIIKDILPYNESRFVTKMKIESYNIYSLSKNLIDVDVDSRYVKAIKTNFFNLIENRTQTKFGINSSFDLKDYPEKIRNSNDFRSISNFVKNKTIKDNSKSIAIIMTRYLVFILVDFLRFSKSLFLQDEKINSFEAQKIIKALSFALPTITEFQPKFESKIKSNEINENLIFTDKEENENENENEGNRNHKSPTKYEFFKPPGFSKQFDRSFKSFLKKSENFISAQFVPILLRSSFDISYLNQLSFSSSFLYSNLSNKEKLESSSPLQKNYNRISIRPRMKNLIQLRMNGHIPLLPESIPEVFPCATTDEKNIRTSSDIFSIFIKKVDRYSLFHWNWNYDERKIKRRNGNFDINSYKNYKFRLGLFFILKNMQEFLLNSSLGFIQNVFTIIQSFNDSETLLKKSKEFFNLEFINLLFKLASKKDPIAFPFLQMIFLSISSKGGFSDSLIQSNSEGAARIFSGISDELYEISSFPSSSNEPFLLFSIYSNLIRSRIIELKKNDSFKLFDEYSSINKKLFKIGDNKKSLDDLEFIEGDLSRNNENFIWNRKPYNRNLNKKKKNFRSFYLVYYYSVLLNNESNFQYPKFIFINDWLRQHFGCFRKTISFDDINDFLRLKNSDSNVHYKSEVLQNDDDLNCSLKCYNIIDKTQKIDFMTGKKIGNPDDNKELAYKVFVHQLKNNEKIEIPKSGKNILVSFPIEIIIVHDEGKKKKEISKGDFFVFTFRSPKERQFFIDNHEQINKEFDTFISLSKYDNELSAKSLSLNEQSSNNNNNNNDTNNNNNDNSDTNNNNNDNNNNNSNNNTTTTNNNNTNNNNNNNDDDGGGDNDDNDEDEENLDENENEINYRNEYKKYELEKIPKSVSFSSSQIPPEISDRIISLRLSALSTYRRLIEEIILDFSLDSCSDSRSLFLQQILRPAHSMTTSSKFKFIDKILSSEGIGQTDLTVTFNRFEQQKFMEEISSSSSSSTSPEQIKARPLLVQFMEQVGQDALHLLKVRGSKPFNAELVGEGSIDAGGPARELFSGLIMEMMDDRIGFFVQNPNRRNKLKETNAEELVPCPINGLSGNEAAVIFTNRFYYAGALIAVCVVSGLPQQMKLAPIVWDFLATGSVSIESFYAIDKNFSELISKAENILKRISHKNNKNENDNNNNVNENNNNENSNNNNENENNNNNNSNENNNNENSNNNNENENNNNENSSNNNENETKCETENIENEFCHFFTIIDSFGNDVELVQGGSKISVTSANLSEFITLSKQFRVHEFDSQLRDMKEGFDSVMVYRSVTEMLKPAELRLLACGEPTCSVDQLKKLTRFKLSKLFEDESCIEKLIVMFWNVISSFSVDERMQFVRFASGNLGLPAPGLRWEDDITVVFLSQYEKENEGKNMVFAHTCISTVEIPFFQSEEELEKMLKVSIKFSGIITDSHEDIQTVVEYL